MENIYEGFNPWICFKFKNVFYQIPAIGGDMNIMDQVNSEIGQIDQGRCSEELNKWLRLERAEDLSSLKPEQLRLYPYDKHTSEIFDKFMKDKKNNFSNELVFWVRVLEVYLRNSVRPDTPSCDELWDWAVSGRFGRYECPSAYSELAEWEIRCADEVIYFKGGDSGGMSKKAYQSFFNYNIGLRPLGY